MARPRKRPALAINPENFLEENLGEVEKEVQNVGKAEPQSPVPLDLQLLKQEFVRRAQELCKESDDGREWFRTFSVHPPNILRTSSGHPLHIFN